MAFLHGNAGLGNLKRQQTGSTGYAVLHIYRSKVGVGTHFKINGDTSRAVITGGGCHIGHVIHAINLLFERDDHAL